MCFTVSEGETKFFVNIEKESIQFQLKLTIMEESTLNVVRLLNKTRYNTCGKTSIHRLLGRPPLFVQLYAAHDCGIAFL